VGGKKGGRERSASTKKTRPHRVPQESPFFFLIPLPELSHVVELQELAERDSMVVISEA